MELFIERPVIYNDIINTITDNSHERRLCVLCGEWGIGKSTLLNKVFDDLKNQLRIRMDFTLDVISPTTLKSIVTEFIEHSGVYYSGQSDKEKIPLRDKIFNGLKDLKFGITFRTDTKGSISGSISFNFVTPILNWIEKNYESYINSIQNTSFEDFPRTLARITREICIACDNVLYVVIDDVEKMDASSALLLKELLSSNIRIALILSSEFSLNSKYSISYKELIYDYFLKRPDTNDRFEYSLSYFERGETFQYIKKRFNNIKTLDLDVADLVHEYTRGFPFLLSLVCNDISNIQKISNNDDLEFNSKMNLFFDRNIQKLSETQLQILYVIACNKGSINFEVLKSAITISGINEWTFLDELEFLINQKHIREQGEIVVITPPMFSRYIFRTSSLIQERKKKEYYRLLERIYSDLPDNSGGVEKYYSLSYLYLNLERITEAYNFIIRCYDEFVNKQMPDKAANFLEDILKQNLVRPFDSTFISQVKYKLCNAYYLCKKNELVIEVFEALHDEDFNNLEKIDLHLNLYLLVSKAYYYMNNPINSIKYAKLAIHSENNTTIYFEAMAMLASSYDLQASYSSSKKVYFKALKKALENNYTKQLGKLKMTIQMVSSDYKECLKSLEEAIAIFSHEYYENRFLACSYNNIGIEYLMQGDFANSKLYLKKAEQAFTLYPLESHFSDNNIGLLLYLSEGNLIEALKYLKRAYENSISPLQRAYTMSNRGIVLYELNIKDEALECFNIAHGHAILCPDPIVRSYVIYNLACYYFKSEDFTKAGEYLKDSYLGLKKDQLQCLLEKRNKMLNIINSNKHYPNNVFTDSQRRIFFAACEWEPCELMFYN